MRRKSLWEGAVRERPGGGHGKREARGRVSEREARGRGSEKDARRRSLGEGAVARRVR